MIDWTWIRAAEDAPLMIVCSAVALYALLLLYTRLVRLRSFSKISGFGFAIPIAIGAILASVTLWQKPTLLEGAVALGGLLGLQFVVGNLRKRLLGVTRLVDNTPLLLMDGPEVSSSLPWPDDGSPDRQTDRRTASPSVAAAVGSPSTVT